MGVPIPSDDSQGSVPAQQRPSLFRSLLSGAVIGMLGGLSQMARQPQQSNQPTSFGDDLARGIGGAVNFQVQRGQAQFDNSLKAQQVANDTQRTANDTQRTVNDTAQTLTTGQLQEAQAAHMLVDKLHLEKLISQMPEAEQQERFKTWAYATAQLENAGLQPVTQIQDSDEGRTAFLNNVAQQGGKVTDYTFGPSLDKPGMISVYRADPTRTVSTDVADKLSKLIGAKIPAGIPASLADAFITSTLRERAALRVASINAARQAASDRGVEKMWNYGKNPATGESLSLDNAPDSFLVNQEDGKVIPLKMLSQYKPSQNEVNRAQFAKSTLHILDAIDQLRAKGKLPNGPLRGMTVKKFADVGLNSHDAQEAFDLISMAQSAATGAHVGGRFTNEILQKMSNVLNINMNDAAFSGAEDALRTVMQGYADNAGRMTVAQWKAQHASVQSGAPQSSPSNASGWGASFGAVPRGNN